MPVDPKLLATVSRMPVADLMQLQAAIKATLSLQGAAAPGDDTHASSLTSDEHWALSTLAEFARRQGKDIRGVNQLSATKHAAGFRRKVPGLMQYFAGLKQNERSALFDLGLKLMSDQLEFFGLGVNATNLMDHIHNLPRAIDKEFPGYKAMGILHMIVQRKKGSQRNGR